MPRSGGAFCLGSAPSGGAGRVLLGIGSGSPGLTSTTVSRESPAQVFGVSIVMRDSQSLTSPVRRFGRRDHKSKPLSVICHQNDLRGVETHAHDRGFDVSSAADELMRGFRLHS